MQAEFPRQPDGQVNLSRLREEIGRRRTFAIISHPDAGKTTLTEKLLLYSGQISEAGAVRGRKSQRAATSDWMEMERQRGISITSTVLSFEYDGHQFNLLDTPGHNDFSEDTYRTLTAADCAVMVLDLAKGIEPQTMKLFKICAERKIPIITFVNKLDRPGGDPLATLGEIEQLLGIHAVPMNWPVGVGRDFCGVYDRRSQQVLKFSPTPRGAMRVPTQAMPLDEACAVLEPHIAERLREEVELIAHAGEDFDHAKLIRGEITPVFFGSALSNYGIEPFLAAFPGLCPPPGPRLSTDGHIPPDTERFTGQIFKIQANLDPKHHDRVAFLRVCSGRFTREMELLNARTNVKLRIKRSQKAFAQDRDTIEEAWPGDIVGLIIPGQLRLGDTLCEGKPLRFYGRWHFPPERFAAIRCSDASRRKQFMQGLTQLREEGAIQVFSDGAMSLEPVIGAVGELQFEVVQYRLQTEYRSETTLHRLPFIQSRWITGPAEKIASIVVPTSSRLLYDDAGSPVAVFDCDWAVNYCIDRNPSLKFLEARPDEIAQTG
ncbi:MAG: peptide chain release factor 3 [Planctomycetaceae bacterium]